MFAVQRMSLNLLIFSVDVIFLPKTDNTTKLKSSFLSPKLNISSDR